MKHHLIRFCAEECARQQSGELSVSRMCLAYDRAQNDARFGRHDAKYRTNRITIPSVISLGYIIHPQNGCSRWRTINVGFGPGGLSGFALEPDLIDQAMYQLVQLQDRLTPEQFYQEFETIHPFVDGNGRVGSILYNWKNGTLENPVVPPEYVTV